MAVYSSSSSSSSNGSLLHPNPPFGTNCFFIRPGSLNITTFYIIDILLLLPLCILVIQQWQRQRSTSTATMMSHSDIFTYHMVAMELVGLLGNILCCSGVFLDHATVFCVGYFLWTITWYGETLFHSLTCVDRYLAVVRPVTYLSLRGERGIRLRNISIGCVWLFSVGATGLIVIEDVFLIVGFCLLIFSVIVVAFCSLSVLCVLIRPGPGEQGGDRERVDQTKQRAFYTIMAILGVLLLRSSGSAAWSVVYMLRESSECAVSVAEAWLNVPSSLVLPLLFLHRAGTLTCCKTPNNT